MFAILTNDGGIILQDGDIYKKFDRFGKYVSDACLNSSLVNSKCEVSVISVLTSGRNTDVLLIAGDTMEHRAGSVSDVMNLTTKGGYIRRVRLSFEEQGLKCTQTIFVYDKGEKLSAIYGS